MGGRLEGKRAVITGAGSGMGRAFALAFAREGAQVGVLDLNMDAASAVAAQIVAEGGQAMPLEADVSARSSMVSALDSFVANFGRLDVMFNNAGFNAPLHFLDVTDENWHRIMDVNALGTLIGIQEAARRMIPTGGGKIVNTSSIAGRQGYPSFAPYCASKFAVTALTQAAARALAEHHITCNAYGPGVVDTPLWSQLDLDLMAIGDSSAPGEALQAYAAGSLLGRPATPEDIVGTALFLASSDSDFMTGQIVMIDGGITLV